VKTVRVRLLVNSWPLPLKTKNIAWASGSINLFAIPTASDPLAMVDSLEPKRAGTGLMPKKKASSIPPKLTEAEQDLLAHMDQGYQLETDSLGGNPILRRLKDDEVIRPLSANRSTINALESAASFTQEKVASL